MKTGTGFKISNANFWIVTGFAFAHALTAFSLGKLGISDELLLTLLTLAMTIILCLRRNLNIELTAACAILMNVIGFLLGTEGGVIFSRLFESSVAGSTMATFITTLLLGGVLVFATKNLGPEKSGSVIPASSRSGVRIIIIASALIFLLRILMFIFSTARDSAGNTLEMLAMIMSNSAVTISVVCVNVLFIRYAGSIRRKIGANAHRILLGTFILSLSAVYAVLIAMNPKTMVDIGANLGFLHLWVLCMVMEISIYSIAYLANYAIDIQNAIVSEREKRHSAQFRYEKLKQQVNPHFLFNSLNVLDGLVLDGQNEKASEFIQKLAGLYRYMINSEDEKMVPLGREMDFVDLYVDLMKTRFPVGFDVEEAILKDDFQKCVPPCAVQMLVENAFKHNSVSASNPLKIVIRTNGKQIEVSNLLIPKNSLAPSTGVGLKYIRQQYKDLENKEIQIEQTQTEYIVRLPLIENGRQSIN